MRQKTITRRNVLWGLSGAALVLGSTKGRAEDPIGSVREARGQVEVERGGLREDLEVDGPIMIRDRVSTGASSFAALALGAVTLVRLGGEVDLVIDSFIAEQGGVLDIGAGPILFDRPEAAPPIDMTIRTAFGLIGVRGTKFFAGPSNGVFGVFVERGRVSVLAAGERRRLEAGEGVDISSPGAAPGEVKAWGAPRIAAAYRSVGA